MPNQISLVLCAFTSVLFRVFRVFRGYPFVAAWHTLRRHFSPPTTYCGPSTFQPQNVVVHLTRMIAICTFDLIRHARIHAPLLSAVTIFDNSYRYTSAGRSRWASRLAVASHGVSLV